MIAGWERGKEGSLVLGVEYTVAFVLTEQWNISFH